MKSHIILQAILFHSLSMATVSARKNNRYQEPSYSYSPDGHNYYPPAKQREWKPYGKRYHQPIDRSSAFLR